MKRALRLAALWLLICVLSSCITRKPGDPWFIVQKVPIEIQRDKPINIQLFTRGEVNDVGLRCSPEVWNALTNGTKSITVRLISSTKTATKIGGVDPGSSGRRGFGYIPSTHYLFYIGGKYHGRASVEITFPNAPTGVTRAEVIVAREPWGW